MALMRYFLITGPEGWEGSFPEMGQITVEQAFHAIRESKDKGLAIELYLSRSWMDEQLNGEPEIGLHFKDGRFTHYGLGPGPDEPCSWMYRLIQFINRFKRMDVSEYDGFIQTVFKIADAGFIGT